MFIAILLNCFSLGFSSDFMIKGKTVQHGNPVQNIEVVLYSPNSDALKSVLTDENGVFSIYTPEGDYIIELRQLGTVFLREAVKVNKDINFGEVEINTTQQLKEVVISGKKQILEQKTDRLVFNVENSVMASSGSVLDALKATPSLIIDNDKISVIGKGTIRVMIDDRLVPMSGGELQQFLSSLSASDLKSIEVITTPPAKYDAEGKGGLVNIVLKKKLSDSWSDQLRLSYEQATYALLNIGNSFNFKQGKWNIQTSLNSTIGKNGGRVTSQQYYPTEYWYEPKNVRYKKNKIIGRLGIDYQLTNKASVGGIYSGYYIKDKRDDWGITSISNNNLLGSMKNKGVEDQNNTFHAINLHYIQEIDTMGRKLTVEGDYFTYNTDSDKDFSSFRVGNISNSYHTQNLTDRAVDNYSFRIDMEHPFQWAKLSYGAKYAYTKTFNSLKYYNLLTIPPTYLTNASNDFNYRETIQAVYINVEKALSKRWQVQVGLRLERTLTEGTQQTIGQHNKRDYTQLFPTLYFNYIANENNVFNLGYNRRLNRPTFWELNPFRMYINAYSSEEGNPDLLPEISNSIALKYIHKENFISELFFTLDEDGSGQYGRTDLSTQEQRTLRGNFYNNYIYGCKQTFLWDITPWWSTTCELTLYTNEGKYTNGFDSYTVGADFVKGWNFQFYTQHLFTLNKEKTLQAELTMRCNSPQNELNYKTNAYSSVNIGIKTLLLNKKLLFTLRVRDVFDNAAPYKTSYSGDVKQIYHVNFDSRNLQIGMGYNFGNNKVRVKKRDFGNEEEQDRS